MPQSDTNTESASSSQQPPRPVGMGRLVKACSACRATKIKCSMPDGIPPCERCQARGVNCQVEKNTQSILEETNKWQTTMLGQVTQLQTAVNILLRMSDLPLLSSYSPATPGASEGPPPQVEDKGGEGGGDESLPAAPILTPIETEDDNLYSLPVNSLYEVTRIPSLRDPANPQSRGGEAAQDFISRNLLSETVAQQLFTRFTTKLNWFCYGILCPHETLDSLRKNSTLLTAAICAVASLHDPEGSAAFKISHSEFLRLVSANMFSISHTADDIRALIVGVYWLSNVSFTLLGHVIRIAMRLNYHLAYFSVINDPTQQEDIEKARLWYTLYIMDHHSSILYGRPATISPTEEPHQQWELFIQVVGHCEVDLRLSSQISLYHLISKVKDVFGGYKVKSAPEHCLPQLGAFFAELDRWYMLWGNRLPRNAHVGWFPRDGAILHYHFARLHLCSYIFRAMSLEQSATASPQVRDYAAIAVSSATAVLEHVLNREDLRVALVGMPLYFHGMITFAAVFLNKAARSNFWGLTCVDAPKALDLVHSCLCELRSQCAAPQHLVYHVSNGLQKMLETSRNIIQEMKEAQEPSIGISYQQPMRTMDSMFAMDTFDLFQAPLDPQDLGSMSDQSYHWQGDYEMQP